MNSLIKRYTPESLYGLKMKIIETVERIETDHKQLTFLLNNIDGYVPFYLDDRTHLCGDDRIQRYIDRQFWLYLVRLYELEKYMLYTEYEKMIKDLDNFKFPEFTAGNAKSWINQLKEMIFDNVKYMAENVYNKIVNNFYYTGSSYSTREKKKRNNKGIDSFFILSTGDYNMMFNYWRETPTVTDDLEKLCYILDGKKLPKVTLKQQARTEKEAEAENDYFNVKFCKNGNTHYRIKEETLHRLNSICPDGSTIGEDIKIKVFESFYN